jgi:hypothetical protein
MWLAHISFAEAGKALSPTERSYVLCKAEVADLRTRWRNTLPCFSSTVPTVGSVLHCTVYPGKTPNLP